MASKMPRHLVALSSSAIAAIYFAGLVATRSADAGLAADTPAPTAATSTSTAAALPTATTRPTAVVSATAAPTSTPQPVGPTYLDGTYTGAGTSRRGGVQVSVTVLGGHLSNVTITRVTTQYPVSRIASLPSQVIARQSAQVDRVSGATYSAQAFQQAVQQALASATA